MIVGQCSPGHGWKKFHTLSIFTPMKKVRVIGLNSVPQRMKMHQNLAFPWERFNFFLGRHSKMNWKPSSVGTRNSMEIAWWKREGMKTQQFLISHPEQSYTGVARIEKDRYWRTVTQFRHFVFVTRFSIRWWFIGHLFIQDIPAHLYKFSTHSFCLQINSVMVSSRLSASAAVTDAQSFIKSNTA